MSTTRKKQKPATRTFSHTLDLEFCALVGGGRGDCEGVPLQPRHRGNVQKGVLANGVLHRACVVCMCVCVREIVCSSELQAGAVREWRGVRMARGKALFEQRKGHKRRLTPRVILRLGSAHAGIA